MEDGGGGGRALIGFVVGLGDVVVAGLVVVGPLGEAGLPAAAVLDIAVDVGCVVTLALLGEFAVL